MQRLCPSQKLVYCALQGILIVSASQEDRCAKVAVCCGLQGGHLHHNLRLGFFLIEVDAESAQYWDSTSSSMRELSAVPPRPRCTS